MKVRIRFMTVALLALTFAAVSSAQTPPFNRTVIVPATGNPTADGAALISALAGLSPAPNYLNRWLIKLEPGIYSVGTTPVVMRSYVDIEGSGIVETLIQGAVGPPPGFLLGGLVRGASNAEIRQLTINCLSDAVNSTCQAMSVESANPRLTHVRILVQGTGTGAHWGMRTLNGGPILDNVEVLVNASTSSSNYGIVYGGTSNLNIQRSSITARNALGSNWGIGIREELGWSPMRDSAVNGIGGVEAAGIMYIDSTTNNPLILDNVQVSGYGASGQNSGIGNSGLNSGIPKIYYRAGRVYGATDGINLPNANIWLINSEVQASNFCVFSNVVNIGSSWVQGGCTVVGITSEQCAGVYFPFMASTCP